MSFDTYATLLNKKLVVPSQKTSYVAVERQHFARLLEPHIERIRLDQDWYVQQYPDVRDAIDRGEFSSAAEHYVKVGYFEHRMPHAIEVEEAWYLEQYPDVRDAVASGIFATGQTHFTRVGFREGRFPHPNFRP
jgi:hypothetical protein